ncbi:MAG: ribosomal protein S18-alanine N-acetyltransferase [Nitrospinota bacterium]
MVCAKQTLLVRVRDMRESDLAAVMSIERESFSVPWSRENFRSEFRNVGVCSFLVAEPEEEPGTVAGYACYSLVVDEAHITNFAVRSAYRRRGVAEQLLPFLLNKARSEGARRATLEVRVSNGPAISLYTKFGFEPAAVRKRYYPDNREDALVMWSLLPPGPRDEPD